MTSSIVSFQFILHLPYRHNMKMMMTMDEKWAYEYNSNRLKFVCYDSQVITGDKFAERFIAWWSESVKCTNFTTTMPVWCRYFAVDDNHELSKIKNHKYVCRKIIKILTLCCLSHRYTRQLVWCNFLLFKNLPVDTSIFSNIYVQLISTTCVGLV